MKDYFERAKKHALQLESEQLKMTNLARIFGIESAYHFHHTKNKTLSYWSNQKAIEYAKLTKGTNWDSFGISILANSVFMDITEGRVPDKKVIKQ